MPITQAVSSMIASKTGAVFDFRMAARIEVGAIVTRSARNTADTEAVQAIVIASAACSSSESLPPLRWTDFSPFR